MSKKVGLFYGTQTGNTATIAEMIRDLLGEDLVELHDISDTDVADFVGYDCLMIGSPTWNIGELQADWERFFPDLDDIDFSGKIVADLGCGDQVSDADNLMEAIGILATQITDRGGQTVGRWGTEGSDFDASKALDAGKFVGLAIDEENQSALTDDRVPTWVAQVRQEMGI